MTTPHTSPEDARGRINHLRRGAIYRATTSRGISTGEYLGMETPHGDWAILLRSGTATESIPLHLITSVELAAA